MEITVELLKKIYQRTEQYAISRRWGIPHTIEIDSDGYLMISFTGPRGSDTQEYVDPEVLQGELDVIIQERLAYEEDYRLRQALLHREQEEQRKILEKEQRRQQYLALKQEFE